MNWFTRVRNPGGNAVHSSGPSHDVRRALRTGRAGSRGQILVVAGAAALVLILIVGLVIDYGRASAARRHYQGIVDDAALSAAYMLQGDYTTTAAASSVEQVAIANNVPLGASPTYTSTTSGSTETDCWAGGATFCVIFTSNGSGGSVQATITGATSNNFMSSVGTSSTSVTASAVAQWATKKAACYICSMGNISVQGTSSTITVDNGSLITDAGTGTPIKSGGGGTIIATGYGSVVGDTGGTQCTSGCSPASTVVPPFQDPYGSLPYPTQATSFLAGTGSYCAAGSCSITANGDASCTGACTFNPGVYDSMAFSSATVTLNPGVYVLTGAYQNGGGSHQGGFQVGSQTTVAGNGVLLYFTCPTYAPTSQTTEGACPSNGSQPGATNACQNGLAVSSGASLNFYPATSGTYQGMGIFFDRKDNGGICLQGGVNCSSSSTSASAFTFGTIYAENSTVSIQGGSSCASPMVVGGLNLQGNAALIVDTGIAGPGAPATNPVLPGPPTLSA